MAWSDIVTAPPPEAPGPKPTPEQLANLPSAVGYASPQLPPRSQMQQAMPVDVPLPPPREVTRGDIVSKPTVGPSVLGIPLLPQPGEAKPGEAKKEITPESLGQKQVPEAKSESDTKTVTPESLGQKQVPEAEQKPETKAVTPESLGQKQVPEAEPPSQPPPQPPPQQPPTPMPSGTGAGAPQGAPGPLIPGRDAHISALIASGKTPGEAQAIADGQEAKTLNGQAPQPKPKQPPDIGTLAGEQAYVTGAPVSGIEQQPAEATKPTTSQQQAPEAPITPKPAPADTRGVADFFRKRGDAPITSSNDPRLTTVSAGGQTWQVNKEAAPAFQGFVSELASNGAPITLGTGGGWAYRQKVGAKGISEHAYGGAIDVNQLPGQRGKITPEFQKWIGANPGLLQQIEKHWNIYGGERFGDLGHFEWGGVPISTTSTTAATAGAAAPSAALGPDDAQVAAQLDKNLGGLLKGKGSVYVAMGKKYGVDPRLLAAISMEETGNGSSHVLQTRNNVGGITGPGHSGARGDYMPYNSIEEGIEAEASLIRHGYVGQGLDTIEKIGAKWAPPGAFNDPNQGNAGWPDAVRKFYAALGGTGKLGETSGEYPTFAGGGTGGGAGGSGAGGGGAGGGGAGQPMVSIPSAGGTPQLSGGGPRGGGWGGDSGYGGGSEVSSRTAEASPISLTSLLEAAAGGAAAGSLFRGGGGQPPAQHPAEEEPPPPPPSGGIKAANVLGVRTISPGPPPPAPSSLQAQLLPPPAAPSLPSPGGSAAAQAAMAPPLAPPKGPDPAVVKALMKRGFTRAQAEAFAAKATVSQPGAAAITGGASFKPPAQPSGAPPAKAPPAPALPAPPTKTVPPAKQVPAPPQPRVATRIGPQGSTVGVPNPPGGPSPDDPRVKKQKDNLTKGEHFVPGDDSHDQLLSGLPGGHGGRQRQILGQAEQAIADKTPLHLSYISAPKEASKFPTRESRTVQYDAHSPEARLMGTTEGQLVGHSLIPTAVGISPSRKADEPHQGYIQGLSTNVMANNFQHILTKLAAMDRKSPYTKMGQKFANDLEGYLANLQAGHTGTGRGYAIGTEEYPSTPDESHVPYKLTRGEADFLNLVINNTGAFAKHEDGQALRELARANGTLINEKGETNRLRHQIEQHEPGWRERVLEPTIRSFKAGLIHEIHPTEKHMPESIRPGKEYHSLTEATARTSQRGRPDVPVAVSLHHTFTDNKRINEIERDFSDERINEAQARSRLKALGEDPDEYQFVGGSGGLITPYEDDGEQISPSEHATLKSNLRKQWISGKMPIEDYRRKVAEVPLPTRPSSPAVQSEESRSEPEETPSSPVHALPSPAEPSPATSRAAKPRQALSGQDLPSTASSPESLAEPHEETPETPAPAPKPAAPIPKAKPAPKAPQEPPEAPERPGTKTPEPAAAPETPPAAPTASVAAPKASAKKAAKEPPPPRPISPETQKVLGAQPKNAKQGALWQQAGERLDTQIPEGIPLEVDRGERGKFKTDPKGKVLYKKVGYDIANAPLLQKQGKALGQELNKKTGKMGMAKPPTETEDDLQSLDPEKRLIPFLNPTDRKRVAHLNDISAVDTYADELHKMYQGIENLPEVMKGKNWYDEAVNLLRQHFGSHADMMANLLGATSAGNAVKINYNMALDAYHQFLRGHYDEAIKLYNQAYDIKQSGKGALIKHVTDNGIHEALGEEAPNTDEAAMEQWITHHNLTPRGATGKLFGHNSVQVLKVLAHNWEEQAGGPKTPNFAANLNGRSMQATIDMWAARTMRRLGFEGHTSEPWMIQPAGESGVHNVDFGLSQLAFKKAADKIGIKPSALQAILWFAEQKEWQKRGWEREQDPDERDYRPMLKKYQRPGDITEAQAGKFHPSVPELEARLKGAGGVLHMQGGGLVDDPDPDPATGPLANARDAYTQEMANNPDVRQRLINRTYAEVGDQSPQAWQAFIESSMNRGVARNQTLDHAISPQSHYFPNKTAFPKPAPQDFAAQVQPYIDQALAGSNLSNLATGNQSGDVKSGGAPITFDPKVGTLGDEAYIRQLGLPKLDYEQFVTEKDKRDTNWAAEMRRQQANPLPVAQAVNKMGGYGPENQPPPPPPAPASTWYPQQAPVAPPPAPAVAPPVSPFGFRAPPAPLPEE